MFAMVIQRQNVRYTYFGVMPLWLELGCYHSLDMILRVLHCSIKIRVASYVMANFKVMIRTISPLFNPVEINTPLAT
jgi:hypothetical protein